MLSDLDFNNLPSSICGDYELHVPFIMLTGWHRVTATRQEQHLMARSLLKESPGPVSLSTECCEKHCGDKENLNGSFTDDQGDSQIYVSILLTESEVRGRSIVSYGAEPIHTSLQLAAFSHPLCSSQNPLLMEKECPLRKTAVHVDVESFLDNVCSSESWEVVTQTESPKTTQVHASHKGRQ
ncbi:hypothetical protein MJT46_009736 [Ovis ammon polii x Ovis aries]|nr:hypothetical protein MJT46_009736 [Ovis ammon polii x Ovis aries]